MNKIAIIGHGNVGYHLANCLSSQQYEVTIFSRNSTEKCVLPLDNLVPSAFDFIVLCVSDDAVKKISNQIDITDATLLHTSGSRPLSDLDKHTKCGVIYPLQTLSKAKKIDFLSFPIFIEASEEAKEDLLTFVQSFGKDIRFLTSANRIKLHLAAVFACNFSNHLYHVAEIMLAELAMPFRDLQPLVEETLKKAIELTPSKSQTGPAVREDKQTMQQHEDMLQDKQSKKIYKLMTKNIQRLK